MVERDGLENRCTGNRTVGSNPTLSARLPTDLIEYGGNISLLVTARGGRSWVFRYARGGRSHDIGIGSAADVSLANARIEAARLRGILRDDKDPKAVREAERRRRAPSAKPIIREFGLTPLLWRGIGFNLPAVFRTERG